MNPSSTPGAQPAEASEQFPIRRGAFPTTRWSLVVHAAAGSETQVRVALESLCRLYWYPLYAFARRQGRSHHEAEDRTQEFLASVIANERLAELSPERGRFRAFLLTALRHFLVDEWRSAHAAKRGGEYRILSLEMQDGERRFSHEPVDTNLTPEQSFDRNWAHSMSERAAEELRTEYTGSGRGRLFDALRPFLLGNVAQGSLKLAAGKLAMTDHAFTVAVHRLRRRFGERLRAHVAETVDKPADVNDELRHLISAISASGNSL
jgi:RNA polymerase sigma-70 factor (ECF subfamily)